ncbi:MAG: tryptophan synthase subunit alpha [Deltaproteobacteria bacterium]|nr:tryptophan synthase subunit alpha [Deltaproteobacteria bacterium]
MTLSYNRITELFKRKPSGILSVYCTAGYPSLNDTVPLVGAMQSAGADMVEIGIPFSDPVADGPTIQGSNEQALRNGMSLERLMAQLKDLRPAVNIPALLMGYVNPIIQYGAENFCRDAAEAGIDGVIIPDLPPEVYLREFEHFFRSFNILNILLVTPQTTDERIRWIDSISTGFIYAVSSSAITGGRLAVDQQRSAYLLRLSQLKLKNPLLVGFGVSSREDCLEIGKYASGVIIGSAFIRAINASSDAAASARDFIKGVVL